MGFYGRHRCYIIFWPWNGDPFVCFDDLDTFVVSKSCGSGSSIRLSIKPRDIPYHENDQIKRQSRTGYLDVLKPNDWFFVIVDRGDGTRMYPLGFGFIDRIYFDRKVDPRGSVVRRVEVSASGWEKVVQNTGVISDAWIAESINIPTLLALGPLGQLPQETTSDENAGEVGGIYQRLLPDAITFLLRLFLYVDNNKVSNQHTGDSIEELVEYAISGNIESGSRTETDTTNEESERALRPLMGQMELPNTGKTLWEFLTLAIENIQKRVFIAPDMFANNNVTSLASLIDSLGNVVLNEIIYDVRNIGFNGLTDLEGRLYENAEGGYSADSIQTLIDVASGVDRRVSSVMRNVSPYFILRKRPLFQNELLELDGPEINDYEFSSMNLGYSDSDLHNITALNAPDVTMSVIRINSGYIGFERYRNISLDSIRRHGLRYYQDTTISWPAELSTPHASPELIREDEIRLHKAGLDNVETWNGSVAIRKFVDNAFIGGKLVIHHRQDRGISGSSHSRVYYVDTIDYSFDASTGSFSTAFGLTRGYKIKNTGNSLSSGEG